MKAFDPDDPRTVVIVNSEIHGPDLVAAGKRGAELVKVEGPYHVFLATPAQLRGIPDISADLMERFLTIGAIVAMPIRL